MCRLPYEVLITFEDSRFQEKVKHVSFGLAIHQIEPDGIRTLEIRDWKLRLPFCIIDWGWKGKILLLLVGVCLDSYLGMVREWSSEECWYIMR